MQQKLLFNMVCISVTCFICSILQYVGLASEVQTHKHSGFVHGCNCLVGKNG